MSDQAHMRIGAIGGLLAAIVCCATPLLIVALGSLGISSFFANGSYLLIPILAVLLGLVGLRFYRRHASVRPCCDDRSFKEGVKS
jgi:mercuric ion transport protein